MTDVAQQVEICSKGPYGHKYIFMCENGPAQGSFALAENGSSGTCLASNVWSLKPFT